MFVKPDDGTSYWYVAHDLPDGDYHQDRLTERPGMYLRAIDHTLGVLD
jgi:hypothetical protein